MSAAGKADDLGLALQLLFGRTRYVTARWFIGEESVSWIKLAARRVDLIPDHVLSAFCEQMRAWLAPLLACLATAERELADRAATRTQVWGRPLPSPAKLKSAPYRWGLPLQHLSVHEQ